MSETQPIVRLSTPALAIAAVALLGTFVALAAIEPVIAILIVIFGFVFGDNLLRYVSVSTGDDEPTADDELPAAAGDSEDALERLRVRYADGELSDAEFERRLEVLLETETIADVERYLDDAASRGGDRDIRGRADRDLERTPE